MAASRKGRDDLPYINLETWLMESLKKSGYTTEPWSREKLLSYQLQKLRLIFSYARERSSFYRRLYADCNLENLESLQDLDKLPLLSPSVLCERPLELLCCSLGDVKRAFTVTSSGTTGPQKRYFSNYDDIERTIEFMRAGMNSVCGPDDVVQVALPGKRPYGQMDLLARAVEKMGARAIRAGISLNGEEHFKLIEENGTTVLFGSMRYVYRISQEMKMQHDLRRSTVRLVFITSEHCSEAMRQRMQEIWHCEVRLHYGMTELGLGFAVECLEGSGYHCNELGVLVEAVDPQTGKVLPEGQDGVLVYTTLDREAMPLIRFCSHDLGSITTGPCSCGSTGMLKISPVRRRVESIVRVGEVELYPSILDECLFSFPTVVDYQATLVTEAGSDFLRVELEVLSPGNEVQRYARKALKLIPALAQALETGHLQDIDVKLFLVRSMARSERSKKLIRDERRLPVDLLSKVGGGK